MPMEVLLLARINRDQENPKVVVLIEDSVVFWSGLDCIRPFGGILLGKNARAEEQQAKAKN